MADDIETTRRAIGKIVQDFEAKVASSLRERGTSPDGVDEAAANEARQFAERLWWIFRVALAHSQAMMPWRAHPPTKEDEAWCDAIIEAVRQRRARPTHPNADIEQVLLDAFPT